MFAEQLCTAITSSTPNQLHHLSKEVWRAWASGSLSDTDAQQAAERIAERKRGIAGYPGGRNNAPTAFSGARPTFPKRKNQRSPDRRQSIERRRRLAASGPLPPAWAAKFTVCEQAVMRIIADEVRQHGSCFLHLDAIAARAGVSRSTVQRALREAQLLGLITLQERRRAGQKSLTNIVRVISQEWRGWLRLADKGGWRSGSRHRGQKSAALHTFPNRAAAEQSDRFFPLAGRLEAVAM